jgi:hypothetical protein
MRKKCVKIKKNAVFYKKHKRARAKHYKLNKTNIWMLNSGFIWVNKKKSCTPFKKSNIRPPQTIFTCLKILIHHMFSPSSTHWLPIRTITRIQCQLLLIILIMHTNEWHSEILHFCLAMAHCSFQAHLSHTPVTVSPIHVSIFFDITCTEHFH